MNVATPAPMVLAQENTTGAAGDVANREVQFEGEVQARSFFTEPPVDETIDILAGEAGPENEVDTFPYTPNVLPLIAG